MGELKALLADVGLENVRTDIPSGNAVVRRAQRTKSRPSGIASSPIYKSMAIRSWQTTLGLRDLVKAVYDGDASAGST